MSAPQEAAAQEVQITGPLAGAPAFRRLRLHRQDRFDVALAPTFTLLDEFRRHVLFMGRANYHLFDWLGFGVFGGGGLSFNTGLSDELQLKAIDGRNCDVNDHTPACVRTAVSLCKGDECLDKQQLGRIVWMVAPQVTLIPFRGKFSFFGKLFLDADISVFLGAGIVGLSERADCDKGKCPDSFDSASRVAVGPTFGLGFNFYPFRENEQNWLSFGAEFRGTPFSWNTSGFDTAGPDGNSPDDVIDENDRSFHFNPMLTVFVAAQLPPKMPISD